ncbi:MAG: hypothetical protein ACMUIL_03485 [bacterium]
MDKIIILVILYLMFKFICRFLTEMQGQKRGNTLHPLPSGLPRPGIPRTPGAESHEIAPPPMPEDVEGERIMEGLYPSDHKKTREDTTMMGQAVPYEHGRGDPRKDEEIILPHFGLKDGHAALLQGIILAEILGPPVSRRRRLMTPYLRG